MMKYCDFDEIKFQHLALSYLTKTDFLYRIRSGSFDRFNRFEVTVNLETWLGSLYLLPLNHLVLMSFVKKMALKIIGTAKVSNFVFFLMRLFDLFAWLCI